MLLDMVQHTVRTWIELGVGAVLVIVASVGIFQKTQNMWRFSRSPYTLSTIGLWDYATVTLGLLLVGSVGIGLLTRTYCSHERVYHFIWLVGAFVFLLSFFTIIFTQAGTP